MLRIHLTDSQRSELRSLRRTDLPSVSRNRLGMILLSDLGWSAPRIAAHLGCHPHPARAALQGFTAPGTAAFTPDSPGPEPDHARREFVTGKRAELLGQGRTWTSRPLAEALGPDPRDRPPSDPTRPRPTEGRLPADRPDRLSPARSREGRAGRAGLGELEKKVEAGRLRRFDLDAWGFRPSLPTGDSGCLPGQRKWVQHEYPQGRRVNARATHEPFEPVPGLDAVPFERTITSEDLRADLRDRRPSAEVPGWGFGITVAFTSARS